MPLTEPELWKLIETWPLPSRAAPIPLFDPFRRKSFAKLLYDASNWTDESVESVISIYRKFLYLKAISPGPVTPSKTIDSAWHLHLEFDEDYQALCRATGRELRHDTSLSKAELDRAYLDGRALYGAEFDVLPDADLWPSPTIEDNVSAKGMVAAIVGLSVFGCFVAAFVIGGSAYWVTFGAAVCCGLTICAWAELRWPGNHGPEERSSCG